MTELEAVEKTAERVALWRAIHVQVDAAPHVLEDEVGLQLAGPDQHWRERPDMNPQATSAFRASIVARARFIEDLVVEHQATGVDQYVILGAGLDTFAQRRQAIASKMRVFELDQPGPLAFKRRRLNELGFGVPDWLRLVPTNFETARSWKERLVTAGFDAKKPAVVACTGVSMYLTRDANAATLAEVAQFAPGSTLAISFLLPIELMSADVRPSFEWSAKGAKASGTPFISFFSPDDLIDLAKRSGFKDARHVSAAYLTERYFAGRSDGLHPPSAEEIVLATT